MLLPLYHLSRTLYFFQICHSPTLMHNANSSFCIYHILLNTDKYTLPILKSFQDSLHSHLFDLKFSQISSFPCSHIRLFYYFPSCSYSIKYSSKITQHFYTYPCYLKFFGNRLMHGYICTYIPKLTKFNTRISTFHIFVYKLL